MKELKKLDLTKNLFTANGVTYHIESALSIERFCEFQILEKEAGFGVTFKTMFSNLQKLHELMNSIRFVEASVLLNNMMSGVAKVEEREPTLLKICALFINEADEDRSTINDDMIIKKIDNWKAEGFDTSSFFTLALNTVNGFLEIYANVSRIISEPNKNEKD